MNGSIRAASFSVDFQLMFGSSSGFDHIRLRGYLPVSALLLALPLMLFASRGYAQADRIYPLSGNMVSGKITDVKPDGVTIESGSNKQTIAVDQIQKIMYEGDPAPLTKGREFALDGQWEQALDELKQVELEKVTRDLVKADATYYLAASESHLALVGRGSTSEAAKKMLAFAGAYPQSIHFYDAAKLLGDLAVSMGIFDKADQYYKALAKSPSPDLKIESVYLTGLAKLRQGKAADAQADFDKVIGASVQSTIAARLQTLSKAGRAVALSQQGKGDEGLKLVETLISELNTADSEMASRIYNAQGASFEATGDVQGAVMAYLHTHLMFSGQADAHAEALSHLVQLWTKVGKPDRAAEAREELQQRYPGWGK
jgi:tetratricopeptide (TPR) repeat protein